LLASARGTGYRRIAAQLDRPLSIVRGAALDPRGPRSRPRRVAARTGR
jgi:hypothetical protein